MAYDGATNVTGRAKVTAGVKSGMSGDRLLAFVCATASDDEAIYGCAFDPKRRRLETRARTPAGKPMYAAVRPDRETLYAVERKPDPRVTAYRIVDDGGALRPLNHRPTGGAGPCYVSVDRSGECVFVANYAGGTVASFPLESDGYLGEGVMREHDADGGEAHPHAVVPGPENRFLYAPDLGTDRIVAYRMDLGAGEIHRTDSFRVPDGTGPRHLAFGPDGDHVYLIGELNATVTAFERDPADGGLERLDAEPIHPAVEGGAADVHVHPSGKWVYASLRGHDSVTRFDVNPDGTLTRASSVHTGGEWPRDFNLDPAGTTLLAENANSDTIVCFAMDDAGELRHETATSVGSPVCLVFLDGA